MRQPFVRQPIGRHDRLFDNRFTDMTVCATDFSTTRPFVRQFIVRNGFLCDKLNGELRRERRLTNFYEFLKTFFYERRLTLTRHLLTKLELVIHNGAIGFV